MTPALVKNGTYEEKHNNILQGLSHSCRLRNKRASVVYLLKYRKYQKGDGQQGCLRIESERD